VLHDFGGAQFSAFKQSLAELAIEKLGSIGAEMRRLEGDPTYLDQILRDGAARARAIAQPIMDQVKDIVGLLR
jgi:tryptophanyl-tRNA synthetase